MLYMTILKMYTESKLSVKPCEMAGDGPLN